jgi:hypothetical protein
MKELASFIKRTFIGVAYVVGSPIIALVFAFFFVYGTLIFVFSSLHSIYLFFSGQGVFSPFEEDLKANTRYEFMQRNHPTAHRETQAVPEQGEKS